jgi:hypothetical protein
MLRPGVQRWRGRERAARRGRPVGDNGGSVTGSRVPTTHDLARRPDSGWDSPRERSNHGRARCKGTEEGERTVLATL